MNQSDLSEKKSEIASAMEAILEARGLLENWAKESLCCGNRKKVNPTIKKLDEAFDFLSREL